jgi:hypothetical protein
MWKLSVLSAVFCVACSIGADAGGRQTSMTGYYSAGGAPRPRFSFLDKDGNINMQCGVLEENEKEVGFRFFKITPQKKGLSISNNFVLLEDGSVWILYLDWLNDKSEHDYNGNPISGGYFYYKDGKQNYKDICSIADKEHGIGIFFQKVIGGGVKKILATDHFVLALRNDGVILGFGSEEGNGFGNPDATITEDRVNGPWHVENTPNLDDALEDEKYKNPNVDVSTLLNKIERDYLRKYFLPTAAKKNADGSFFIKEFKEFKEEVIDIAANDSLLGVVTKSGQVYIWGWGDMYGFARSSSAVIGNKEKIIKIDHAITDPRRIFFGKQYVFVSDADGGGWVWGGRRHEWPGPYGYIEFPSLEALDIKSTAPQKVSIPLDFDRINPITTIDNFYEPYGPVSFLDKDRLAVGYIFADVPSYPRWLNQDELEYRQSWHGRPLFLNIYDGRIVDVSVAHGKKIVSTDIYIGISIDEDDNLYRYEKPQKGQDINVGEGGLIKKELERDREVRVYFPPPILVPVKKIINPAEVVFK